jgi:TM2 domain-containing membrane protein YozV
MSSMPPTVFCPHCGRPMGLPGESRAATIRCPACGHTFRPLAVTGWRDPEGYPASPFDGYSPRSRVVAGLLGIFLGFLGAHRFYLGYTTIGAIQLGLTLVNLVAHKRACCVPIVVIWGFIEGVLCLAGKITDAERRPLRP